MEKITVIIPTYNYEKYICDAIDSVLTQEYENIEIIVVDDGSTDNTKNVVQKYGEKIKYFSKNNEGPAAARNYGIIRAKGKYICFLDADDIFLPDKLSIQVNLFEEKIVDKLGLIYSDFLCIDQYENRVLKYYKSKGFDSQKNALNYLMKSNYINTSTVMISKEVIEKAGYFNASLKYLEDLDLWLRIGAVSNFLYVNKPLVKTRSHPNNFRNKVSKKEKQDAFKIVKKNFVSRQKNCINNK